MPAIPGSGIIGQDELLETGRALNGHQVAVDDQNVISDEVIQELGMWEQVIQEEKKDGGATSSGVVAKDEAMEESPGSGDDEYFDDEQEESGGMQSATARQEVERFVVCFKIFYF